MARAARRSRRRGAGETTPTSRSRSSPKTAAASRPGTCFVCRSGHGSTATTTRRRLSPTARSRSSWSARLPLAVPQARVVSVPRALGPAAARLYGDPSRSMRCLGVTGTAGKSTTAALLEGIAPRPVSPPGSSATTACSSTVLRSPSRSGAARTCRRPISFSTCSRRCATTAWAPLRWKSRRALDVGRVDATWFAAACFTNLSHEHLDDHGSLEAYFQAKLDLFDPTRVATVATNIDDLYGARVRDRAIRSGLDVWTYAVHDGHADIGAREVVLGDRGTMLTVVDRRSGVDTRVESQLIGAFNVANILAAAATARAAGFGMDA